jgi:hypothetical protein
MRCRRSPFCAISCVRPTAIEMGDGRRVFAPADSSPAAVKRQLIRRAIWTRALQTSRQELATAAAPSEQPLPSRVASRLAFAAHPMTGHCRLRRRLFARTKRSRPIVHKVGPGAPTAGTAPIKRSPVGAQIGRRPSPQACCGSPSNTCWVNGGSVTSVPPCPSLEATKELAR